MTNPWDRALRVTLAAPFESWWVEAYLDPPIGQYLDMRKAIDQATAEPSEASLDLLIATMEPLIRAHNMVDRTGDPLPFTLAAMPARVISALADALRQVGEAGAPAGPLPTPASSPGRGSPVSRSRRTTRSGASRG